MSETSTPNPYSPPATSDLKLALDPKQNTNRSFRALLVVHVAVILIASGWAAVVRIESIIMTGAFLTISGTLLAIFAYRRSETMIAKFALTTPAYATFLFILINAFQWDPFEARAPVTILNGLYSIFSSIACTVILWKR